MKAPTQEPTTVLTEIGAAVLEEADIEEVSEDSGDEVSTGIAVGERVMVGVIPEAS